MVKNEWRQNQKMPIRRKNEKWLDHIYSLKKRTFFSGTRIESQKLMYILEKNLIDY